MYEKQIKKKKCANKTYFSPKNYVKSVHIRHFSGPYSVQMRQNTDQKNSEYGHFSRSENQQF